MASRRQVRQGARACVPVSAVRSVGWQSPADDTEPDTSIPQHGRIALQVHGGGKVEVWYRQVRAQPLR
jgi:hypothetical protein